MDNIVFSEVTVDSEKNLQQVSEEIHVYWAFLYNIACPGWGEKYCGYRRKSYIIGALLAVSLLLFMHSTYNLSIAFSALVRELSQVNDGFTDVAMERLFYPVMYFLAGGGSLYLVWMWSLLSAVLSAKERRKNDGLEEERSLIWPLIMNRICVGSGQLYGNKTEQGYILWGVTVLGSFLILFALPDFFAGVRELFMSTDGSVPAASLSSLDTVFSRVAVLKTYLSLSFGATLVYVVQMYAFADCATIFSKDFQDAVKKESAKVFNGFLLILWGYMCPGSGQILSGKREFGMYIVWGLVAFPVVTAFLVGIDVLPRERADTILMVPALFGWVAIIEAPVRLFLAEKVNDQSAS